MSSNSNNSGVKQFLYQRISAVVILLYTCFLSSFVYFNQDLTYAIWLGLFQIIWVKVFSILTLWFLVIHIWLGMQAVFADYLTERLMAVRQRLSAIFCNCCCYY